jgi:predicted Zn-dependent peptidase
MEENVKRSMTGSGMRLILERIPHVRSCSIGVWINRGSRHEWPAKVGISHFLEHMVFKGTSRRSAREIANSIEAVGGSLDAFTSREYTCFHAKVLDENIGFAIDVLSDLIESPTMADDQMEREKQVVYEEIRNMEDTPDDLIHQLYSETIWGDGPLGYPLLGTYETVGALQRQDVLDYLNHEYTAPNLVVSLAGNFEFEPIIDLLQSRFAFAANRTGNGGIVRSESSPGNGSGPATRHLVRDCQQTHLCLGTVGLAHADPRRYAFLLLSNILGGGMSSRLFQRVREEEALAYVVYSFQQFYRDSGVFGVYVGVEPRQRDRVIQVIREEYEDILKNGVSPEELTNSKNQLKGQLVLGLESTTTRMFRLANFEVNGEVYQPIDEVISRVQEVSPEDIAEVAGIILDPGKLYCVTLGPKPK